MKAIATLSKSGFITSPHRIANQLFYYAFYSEEAQSLYFKSSILSIQAIFYRNGEDLEDLITELEKKLTEAYSRYFDSVDVDVTSVDSEDETSHKSVDVSINIKNPDGDIDLYYNLQSTENDNLKLIEYNNTGEPIYTVSK